jgi:hypothetical protein
MTTDKTVECGGCNGKGYVIEVGAKQTNAQCPCCNGSGRVPVPATDKGAAERAHEELNAAIETAKRSVKWGTLDVEDLDAVFSRIDSAHQYITTLAAERDTLATAATQARDWLLRTFSAAANDYPYCELCNGTPQTHKLECPIGILSAALTAAPASRDELASERDTWKALAHDVKETLERATSLAERWESMARAAEHVATAAEADRDALTVLLGRARDDLATWYAERDSATRTGLLPSRTSATLEAIDAALPQKAEG